MRARRLLTAGIVVVGLGGVSTTAAAGSAATTRTEVIHLLAHGTSETNVDLGPKGFSAGDQEIVALALLDHGARVGAGSSVCQFVEVTKPRAVDLCTTTLSLPAGQITAEGLVTSTPAGPGTYSLAVTGGTGRYRTAHGELTITARSGDTVPVTVRVIR